MDPRDDDLDLGLFGPDSVSWRVLGDPVLAVGGLRALLLQALYPRAMAGLIQTSGYRSDPWGRLRRTAGYVSTVNFGTTAQAERAGARVRAVHARLRTIDPDTGAEFRVDEPRLLRWVHVTEVESFLTTARRAGVRVTAADADAYYQEQRRCAALVGLDPETVPGSAEEVAEYYRAIRPELRLTRAAAEGAVFMAVPPMRWWLGWTPARAGWLGLMALAMALLPPWARRLYGLPGLPTTDLTATLSTRALRLTLATLPRNLRQGPIYRDAIHRAQRVAALGPVPQPSAAQGSRSGA